MKFVGVSSRVRRGFMAQPLLSQGSGISAIACGKKSIKTIISRQIAIQIQLGSLRLAMNGVVDGSSTSIT